MVVPLEVPVRGWPTPEIADGILYEVWSLKKGNYKPIHPGTPHPNTDKYAGFVFVQQAPFPGNDSFVQMIWANDRPVQDTYNAGEIGYSAESNSHPIYQRTYLARRHASGRPLTKALPLTGLIGIRVTNGGSNYETPPVVSFTGGAGSGATAIAIMFRKAVVAVVLTSEGTGYTSAPTVVFTGGGGSNAAATALLQPATALLVEEKEERLEGDPMDGLFVRVIRIYETLPGPILTGQHFNRERAHGAKADETVQRVLASTATLPDLSLSVLDARLEPISSVVSKKIVQELASGQTQPILTGSHVDPKSGIVTDYTKQFVAAGTTGSITASTGQISSLVITQAGDEYTSIPTLVFAGGGGTSAAGSVTTMTAVSAAAAAAGTGYLPGDTVTLAGGTSTTTAVLEVETTKLISLAINARGSGYAVGDLIILDGGTYTTAPAVTVATIGLASLAVDDPGTGYTVADTITLAGGTFTSAAVLTVATVGGSGELLTFTITTRGSYTVGTETPTQGATSGTGTGATFESGLFGVETFTLTDAGVFTTNSATFTQSGDAAPAGGTGATFQTGVFGINSLTVSTAGSYTVLPSNPVAQGSTSGSGTGGTFTLGWGLGSVTLTNVGSGYTSNPIVTVTGGSGTGAGVMAVLGLIFTEIQPVDKWLSIQIANIVRLATLPAASGYHYVRPFSFPDTLRPLAQFANRQAVLVANNAETEIALVHQVKEGYSGPCAARCIERYLYGRTLEAYVPPTVTTFHPEGFQGWFHIPNSDNIVGVSLPRTLHPAITIGQGSIFQTVIPATNPSSLPEGQYICVDIQPEQWRNGVWFVREFYVRVPIT